MKTLFLVVILAASTLSGAAAAEPARPQTRAVAVSTAGLDLASEAGVRVLDLRILHAASALCGAPSSADARGQIKFDQCRAEARANAVAGRDQALQLARGRDSGMAASSR